MTPAQAPIALWVAILLLSSASAADRAEATLRALEAEWNHARLAGDAHRVAELLDKNWMMIHVDGRTETKDSYVRDVGSGARRIQSIEVSETHVTMLGDGAVVTGELLQRGIRRGELRVGRLRFIHVWARRGATWRMIVSQSTEVKPEQ